jgi:hypothetical protein
VICFACQDLRDRGFPHDLGPRDLPLSGWIVHLLHHTGERAGWDVVGFLVLHVGVLDAPAEGEVCFWRWDFWNSNMKRRWKEIRDARA